MKRINRIFIYVCLAVFISVLTGCEKISSEYKRTTSAESSDIDMTYISEDITRSPELSDFVRNVCVIGDSIGYGYSHYKRIPSERCCAQKGISLSEARENIFTVEGLGDYSAAEFMERMKPDYLMIVLGMNDIPYGDPNGFAESYMEFAKELHEISQDTRIFVMSITPVEFDTDTVTNEGVDEYNRALEEMFDGCSFAEFTDAAQALRNEDGYMDEEVSAGDGIHLNEAAYDRLLGQMQSYI